MLIITPAARAVLMDLLVEHPEERVVRLAVKDLDEVRVAISITLEQEQEPEDRVQENQGLTLAIAADSIQRLDGATLQYTGNTFRVEHPNPPLRELRLISP